MTAAILGSLIIGLLLGLCLGAAMGFAFGYDWAVDGVARVGISNHNERQGNESDGNANNSGV